MSKKKVSLEWHTEKRKVNDLIPYEKNPRSLSEKQLADLTKNFKRFNLVEIPVCDVDGRIAAGHQRIKVLQLLGRGEEEIDVRVPNRKLSKKEYEQYLISSNAITGDWDFDKLMAFDVDFLLDVGFDADELNSIWAEHLKVDEGDFDEEQELAKIKKPKTKLGDLIELGNHRLICGDCTDTSVLKYLCGSNQPSMIYSDPPYNLRGGISYQTGVSGKRNYGGDVNDNRTDEEYKNFIRQTMEAALSVANKNVHCFYWVDSTYVWVPQTLYPELGITNKRVCLWIKNGQNPTPGLAFSKCYEPCVYGVRGKPYISDAFQSLNEVLNDDMSTGNNLLAETLDHLDIWAAKRLSAKEYEHATSKPPTLHEKAIRRCTKPGDLILDSFGGSGSTLIAAEQLKRRAYLVELEPIFCDLIIRRFEKLSGLKAKVYHL